MIELGTLTPFQRVLLRTDGTVTHILAAYAGEPIDVVKLLQEYDAAAAPDGPLELEPGAVVLRRNVLLRGRESGRNLLYAEVAAATERVEPSFLEGMLHTNEPIGLLLAEHRTETFREILVSDRQPAGTCAEHFGIDPSDSIIYRTYRIIAGCRPILLITEKFPDHLFRTL